MSAYLGPSCLCLSVLTHWGRMTHICVGKLTIIGSDNGLSPGRRQAIIWTNAGILLNGPLGTNFSEILIEILALSFKKMHMKVSSAKWRPFCLGLNGLNHKWLEMYGCIICGYCCPGAKVPFGPVSYKNATFTANKPRDLKYNFEKNYPVV